MVLSAVQGAPPPVPGWAIALRVPGALHLTHASVPRVLMVMDPATGLDATCLADATRMRNVLVCMVSIVCAVMGTSGMARWTALGVSLPALVSREVNAILLPSVLHLTSACVRMGMRAMVKVRAQDAASHVRESQVDSATLALPVLVQMFANVYQGGMLVMGSLGVQVVFL